MEICPVLVIQIDIGNGQMKEIVVNESDKPSDLAESFCKRHNLDFEVQEVLLKQLEFEIDKKVELELDKFISMENNCNTIPKENSNSKNNSKEKPSFSKVELLNALTGEKTSAFLHEDSYVSKSSIFNTAQKYPRGTEFKNPKNPNQSLVGAENKARNCSVKHKIYETCAARAATPEVGLLQKWKERNQKLEEIRQNKLENERKRYTFQPDISKTSPDAIRNPKKYLTLYQNAKVRNLKLTKMSDAFIKKQCPFKPDTSLTNQANKALTKKRDNRLNKKSTSNAPQESPVKHIIHRSTSVGKTSPKRTREHIHSVLHKKTPQTLQKSKQVLRYPRQRRYRELFDALRPCNGLIHPCRYSNLDHKTYDILKPFLDEITGLDEKLGFKEFSSSLDAFLRTLTPAQRNYLLLRKNKSCEIAKKRIRRTSIDDNLYDRDSELKENSEKKEIGLLRDRRNPRFSSQPRLI